MSVQGSECRIMCEHGAIQGVSWHSGYNHVISLEVILSAFFFTICRPGLDTLSDTFYQLHTPNNNNSGFSYLGADLLLEFLK